MRVDASSHPVAAGFFAWFNRKIDQTTAAFGRAVVWVIARMAIALVLLAVFLGRSGSCSTFCRQLVPQEDQGYAMAAIIMPQAAASIARRRSRARRAIFKGIPGIETRT